MTRRELLAVPFVYQSARRDFRYEFPRDHFNHPNFRTEWWYYTGNLNTPDKRPFGYELTFFRQAISRDKKETSPWVVNDVHLAHLALSDIAENRFYHTERLNRPGPGIAGASFEDRRIWNGNWQMQWLPDHQRLEAVADDFSFSLNLKAAKPHVIHGQGGISQKSAGEEEASHYIAFTRLLTSGQMTVNQKKFEVTGTSWMDHEFFSHSIGGNEIQGWDWFSLQFDDETELMLYQLRSPDGAATAFSSGTFIDRNGKTQHLKHTDFTLQPGRRWRSPDTNGNYPLEWRAKVPALGIEIETKPAMDPQEMVSQHKYSPSYWEGAIRISGNRRGVGYLEMTGYDKGVEINQTARAISDRTSVHQL